MSFRYDELKRREEAGEEINDSEKSFMKSFGAYNTIDQQISYNAKAYTIDYSRYAVKYYSSHSTDASKEVSKEVREMAEAVRGNKPASMAEMTALANELGLKLRMTNDPNSQPTPEEIAQGINVIYIAPAAKDKNGVDQVGHAYFLDNNGNKVNVNSKQNDCFYAVCSKILESQGNTKTTNELRQLTAAAIESNGNFDKALEAATWIRERYPESASTMLFDAGIKVIEDPNSNIIDPKTKKKVRLEVEDQDLTDLNASVNSSNKQDKRGGKYSVLIKVNAFAIKNFIQNIHKN